MAHVFEHGAAVMDKVVQVVKVGTANVELRHF